MFSYCETNGAIVQHSLDKTFVAVFAGDHSWHTRLEGLVDMASDCNTRCINNKRELRAIHNQLLGLYPSNKSASFGRSNWGRQSIEPIVIDASFIINACIMQLATRRVRYQTYSLIRIAQGSNDSPVRNKNRVDIKRQKLLKLHHFSQF